MKPVKILLFLVGCLLLLLSLAFVFPEDGIPLGSNFTLRFHFNLDKLQSKTIHYANIETIIQENQTIIKADTLSLPETETEEAVDTIRAKASSLRQKIQPIEYPNNNLTYLHPFFKKLDNSAKKRVRILHYGDSQIEGDRITGYLRNRFQKQFGGSGPGLLPAIPGHAESSSIIHQASANWIKHAVYYQRDTLLPHKQFGLLGSLARYTTYQQDSSPDNQIYKASLNFSKSGMAYRSVNNFTRCRIFYKHTHASVIVKGFVNDSLIWFQEIDSFPKTQIIQWEFDNPPNNFTVEFEGNTSPDVYGIALDAPSGVSVDNLPFRGSSGTEFTRLDYSQLKEMTAQLNPGLLLVQFGVNIVPHRVKSYDYYERIMTRQLKYLKAVMPHTPILVIGLSDMSQRKGNYYETYPNLELVKQAQYNAAKNAECAFWDMYKAMGGRNSMPSWVFAEPPLASSDFIHFNRKGGHIIAQMLYNALMNEYQLYKQPANSLADSKPQETITK
jgi:hypothetical protein